MPDASSTHAAAEPMTLGDLRLPPVFVADHAIRTLFYQGALSPVDLAKHWRVDPDIAVEAVDGLKSAALVEVESGQSTFERLGRVRLNAAGQAYVAQARSRTWYAGPLPVSLETFDRLNTGVVAAFTDRDRLRLALAPFFLEPSTADEIGQALAGGSTLALTGVAPDEQPELAAALGEALGDEVTVPYAIYASGAVIRVFDRRIHRPIATHREAGEEGDVLRTRSAESQWSRIHRPVLALAGGVLASDVLPAYDEDAKFYLAPTPFKACGGILAILDSASNPDALSDLARLWLIPGRHGTGIMLLRSGERIEVPWRACTVIFGASTGALPEELRDSFAYRIDVSELSGASLREFLRRRLHEAQGLPDEAVEPVAAALEHWDVTRASAALAARYIADRAAYEGDSFRVTDDLAEHAASFGCGAAAKTLRRVA